MRRGVSWIVAAGLVALAAIIAGKHESALTPLTGTPDRILVRKSAHTMSLYRGGVLLRTYKVALGRGGLGDKQRAGDNRVPEGAYRIIGHNRHSAFHSALRIGYPTPIQAAEARRNDVDPGGDIMIHGLRNGLGWLGPLHRHVDWTKGCIAVTDGEIDQIAQAVPDGTSVQIDR